MLDGDGDRVVLFPDDGHPDQCAEVLNLTGDPRDEIILWDAHKMYIYTQDRPHPMGRSITRKNTPSTVPPTTGASSPLRTGTRPGIDITST